MILKGQLGHRGRFLVRKAHRKETSEARKQSEKIGWSKSDHVVGRILQTSKKPSCLGNPKIVVQFQAMPPRSKSNERKTLRLTKTKSIDTIPMVMINGYSTAQVASLIGVSKSTILNWLRDGLVQEPERNKIAGVAWRVWSEADVARARRVKGTLKSGPKPKS